MRSSVGVQEARASPQAARAAHNSVLLALGSWTCVLAIALSVPYLNRCEITLYDTVCVLQIPPRGNNRHPHGNKFRCVGAVARVTRGASPARRSWVPVAGSLRIPRSSTSRCVLEAIVAPTIAVLASVAFASLSSRACTSCPRQDGIVDRVANIVEASEDAGAVVMQLAAIGARKSTLTRYVQLLEQKYSDVTVIASEAGI